MPTKTRSKIVRKPVKQELDLAEHEERLRAIPNPAWDMLRRSMIWLTAGLLLSALGWLALGR